MDQDGSATISEEIRLLQSKLIHRNPELLHVSHRIYQRYALFHGCYYLCRAILAGAKI